MLKPSFKSLEGQSNIAILGIGFFLLYKLLIEKDASGPNMDEILKYATSAKDVAELYTIGNGTDGADIKDMGISGAVLMFMYKSFSDFLSSRTKLKQDDTLKKEEPAEKKE